MGDKVEKDLSVVADIARGEFVPGGLEDNVSVWCRAEVLELTADEWEGGSVCWHCLPAPLQ